LTLPVIGCCHDHVEAEETERARAEDFKSKWIREIEFHYQTLVIKTEEIKDLAAKVEELEADNEKLRKLLKEIESERGK
jgi:hypothetical protein